MQYILGVFLIAYVAADIELKDLETEISTPSVNPCAEGECHLYYECAEGQVITDSDAPLDIRYEIPSLRSCKGRFELCCTLKPEKPKNPSCCSNDYCGHRSINGVGFRKAGNKDNESQFGEFPWTVAILKVEQILGKERNAYQGGGSLISPRVALTAAHLVSGKIPKTLKIRAGEWDTQTKDEIMPHQDRYVSEIVIHEEYYAGGLFNDIALLFLENSVDIAENVNTVCLPPQDYIFDGSRCFVSGWGNEFGDCDKFNVVMRRIELPVVPRDQCISTLRKTRLGPNFELNRSFICAGERGQDICKGFGGSPLVCPVPGEANRYYQAGIVAWGFSDGTPGGYVNVALFREWIDYKMFLKHEDPAS